MSDEAPPEGWADTSLGAVMSSFEAGRNLRAQGHPAENGGCGVLKISAVTWGEFRPNENKALLPGDEPKPHERVREGDLLISRANTSELVGAVVLVNRDYPQLMLPDKILRLCTDTRVVDSRFLVHALRSREVREYFEHNATGTSDSMRNLSQPKIAGAPIRLAPLAEQRRIVEAVEALLAQVNAARDRLARVPLILKRFRQAVLAAACSGKLTEEWRGGARSGQTLRVTLAEVLRCRAAKGRAPVSIGRELWDDVPETWARASLDQVAVFVTDGDHNPPKRVNTGIPHLTAKHVKSGRLLFEGATYVSLSDFERMKKRYDPAPGDVIVTCVGTLGATAIVPPSVSFSPDRNLAAIRPGMCILPRYVKLVVDSPVVQNSFPDASGSTAQPHLYLSDLRALEVPLPPLDEQHEIVRHVDTLFAVADTIERRLAAATSRADALPQSILSKAFRGELVRTEAELALAERRSFESAEELLGRVRREAEAKSGGQSRGLADARATGRSRRRRRARSASVAD